MSASVQKLLTAWVVTLCTAFAAFGQNDLSLQVSTASGTVAINDNITFTIVVNNQGATSVSGVQVTNVLPSGMSLVSATPGAGSYNTGTNVWNIGSIAGGTASVSLTLVVQMTGEGAQTLQSRITAMAQYDGDSDPTDPSPLEDDYSAACVTVPVQYCQGTTIDLTTTAPAGYSSYQWFKDGGSISGANSQSYNITEEGEFTFTVNGGAVGTCGGVSCCPVIVEYIPLPTPAIANLPNTTVLNCTNPSIQLTASGGTSYAWSTGAATAAINVTTPATYTVTVTAANGCTATSAVTITQDITPPTPAIANAPNTTVLNCTTTSIQLTASGGTGYAWSTGASTAAIDVTTPATYTVTVTAANGCTATSAVTITQDITPPTPAIANAPNTTVLNCTNPSIQLIASGGTGYAWSTGASTAAIDVTTPATYTVTVTAANGCTATSAVTITQDITPPTPAIANAPNTTVLNCTNPSIQLTASGGTGYAWSTGASTAAIDVTTPATYTVTVTAANGCTATSAVTITQDITPPTPAIANLPNTTVLNCTTTSIQLTASGGTGYAWSTGASTAAIDVTTPATYTVTVTAANGCTATSAVTITQDITQPTPAFVNAPNTTELTCLVTSIGITASGGTSYAWSTGASTAAISVATAGTYTVTVTGTNGCTNVGSVVITGACTVDYADLPDGTAGTGAGDYQTLSANNGPSHGIITGLSLGASVDAEGDGQPSATGNGDDSDVDGDDDDGVVVGATYDIVPGGTIRVPIVVTNTTGNTAYLVAWIDWNGDGDFGDVGEQVATLNDGSGSFPAYLEIPVPAAATTGTDIGLIVRLSNTAVTSPDGYLNSGEVESFVIDVNCPAQICLPVQTTKN